MNMKKLIGVLLAILLLAVPALGAELADVTGLWYMTATELNGQTLTPLEMGMEVTLTLNEDGTGDMTNVGRQTLAGTWTMDENNVVTLADGDKVIARYQYEDGSMRVIESAVILHFDRKSVVPQRPVGKAAQSAEEFYGIYTLDFLYDEKSILTADMLGVEAVFMVTADGLVSMDDNNQPVITPYVFAPVSGKLAATDGVSVMAVELNEDGSISIHQGSTMSMCLRRVQEQQ